MKKLEEINLSPKTIIIITLPYHMRRSSLTFKAVFGKDIKIIRHTILSSKYTKENYFKDFNG